MKNIKKIYKGIPEGEFKNLIYKIYRKNKSNKPKFPSYAQIEPTTRCNLNCVMCMRNDFLNSGIMKLGDMNFENFKKILDKIPSTKELDLQGVGEPFLNEDIFRMIKYAKNKGLKVFTVTNATLIGEMSKNIVESGLDLMKISFYSPDIDVYEKIMKNSNMKRVINNIKLLNEMKGEYNSETPILELTLGAMENNLHTLSNFPELAYDVGINKLIIGEIYGYGKPIILTNKTKKIIEEVKKKSKKFEIETTINIPKRVYDFTKICLWPWKGIYITWDGYVKPCCSRPYFINFDFGNIIELDFEKIWNSEKYIKFREMLKSKNVPLMCKGCQYDFSVFGAMNEKIYH
jgi:radical SAM protein with 4Fe4S-binding SPASM domain